VGWQYLSDELTGRQAQWERCLRTYGGAQALIQRDQVVRAGLHRRRDHVRVSRADDLSESGELRLCRDCGDSQWRRLQESVVPTQRL
jgi:hypothetical protein